jgi:hypothetical protein
MNALKRAFEYSKLQTRRFDMTKTTLDHIKDAFNFEKITLAQDNYPTEKDLCEMANSLQMTKLSA